MVADMLSVDDEADIRDLVAGILQDEGYDARTARNSDDALAAIASRKPNLVFLDIWLQGSTRHGLQLLEEVKQLKQLAPQPATLIGRSAAIAQLRQTIDRVAPTNSRILVVGPSGSGKELTARTIHQLSGRANGPFIVINAAAITPDRMEVELFGVDRSNGSEERKPGALEEAHGGTLFLDDVAEMPRETQNKILRVLVDQHAQDLI